jgi:hypothetical protein
MLSKLIRICFCLVLITLFAMSCSEQNSSTGNDPVVLGQLASAVWVPPAGATFQSASLYIYVEQRSNQEVTIHRVESDWDETTVTWNNFGGAYNAAIEGSFMVDATGWKSADISGLVGGWFNGTYENYGLLIDQPTVYFAMATYSSREAVANQPFIKICYDMDGNSVCEDVPVIADAYIRELYQDLNHGTLEFLATGWGAAVYLEKQSLLRIEIEPPPPPPPGGCTRTIGYWYNWGGFGPQEDMVTALLPHWLGTPGGSKSIFVDNGQLAHDLLGHKVYGKSNNGITKLYAQLLAAKLNFASGADNVVGDEVAAADAFLADHDYLDWAGLDDATQEMILDWHGRIDDYNNGLLGVPHCCD